MQCEAAGCSAAAGYVLQWEHCSSPATWCSSQLLTLRASQSLLGSGIRATRADVGLLLAGEDVAAPAVVLGDKAGVVQPRLLHVHPGGRTLYAGGLQTDGVPQQQSSSPAAALAESSALRVYWCLFTTHLGTGLLARHRTGAGGKQQHADDLISLRGVHESVESRRLY